MVVAVGKRAERRLSGAANTHQEEELGRGEQLDGHAHTLPLPAGDTLATGVTDDHVLDVANAHQLNHVDLALHRGFGQEQRR